MKIAVIAHAHFAIKEPFAGGLEAHTSHMVKELQRLGHEVALYAKAGSDPELNVTPIFFGSARGGKSRAYHLAFKFVMKRMRLSSYDLIINNSLSPVVLREHTPDMPPMLTIFHIPPDLPLNVEVLLGRPLQANRSYVAVSELTASQWRNACQIPVSVISNGINTEEWNDHTQVTGNRQPVAVWTGRITPEKGTHVAVEACKKLGIKLILAGSLYDKKYFKSVIAPHLKNSQVSYVGHLHRSKISELYASADVALVTPVWDEPFGLVAIEALASGVPVAALPNGALPTIIDDSVGALAVNDTPDALAGAIQKALNKDRSVCRQHVENNFTLESMVANYLNEADNLLSNTSHRFQWQTYP